MPPVFVAPLLAMLLLQLLLLAAAAAAPTGTVLLEPDLGLGPVPTGAWRRTGRCPGKQALHLTLVLRKTAAQHAALERAFWDVSTPSHARYGRHLSRGDVTELVAPPEPSVRRVVAWLRDHGAAAVKIGAHRDLLSVEIPARAAEDLFGARVDHYAHATLDVPSICRSAAPYYLPAEMAALVALVGNLHHFPDVSRMQLQFQQDARPQPLGQQRDGAAENTEASAWPSSDCTSKCASGLFGKRITPGVLSAAYNLGDRPNATSAKGNIAVAEFTQVFYDQKELTRFGQDCGAFARLFVVVCLLCVSFVVRV